MTPLLAVRRLRRRLREARHRYISQLETPGPGPSGVDHRKDVLVPPPAPFRDGDSMVVHHGAEPDDIVRMLRHGIHGQARPRRRFSYERDNNPKGLFVTPTRYTAAGFGGHIVTFRARHHELEAPVWNNQDNTWTRGHEGYFGDSAAGRRRRADFYRERREKTAATHPDPAVRGSTDPLLAHSLYHGPEHERQALFTGHLHPNRIMHITTPQGEKLRPREWLKRIKQTRPSLLHAAVPYDAPPGHAFDPKRFYRSVANQSNQSAAHTVAAVLRPHNAMTARDIARELTGIGLHPKHVPQAVKWAKTARKHIAARNYGHGSVPFEVDGPFVNTKPGW